MLARASRPLLRPEPPSLLVGLAVAPLSVAAITGLIFALREVSPVESNGVAYLPQRAVRSASLGRGLAVWQLPARPREVAGVAVRVALEVVLVLGLGLPEGD